MATKGSVPKVYGAVKEIAASLGELGIQKSRRNQQQGYAFRGIDQVYEALSPLLAKNGVVIVPRVLSRECNERPTRGGGVQYNVVLHCEFDVVAVEDGSLLTVATFGEAIDSADKATNKALSAAYKYVCFTLFCIPVEGTPDADAETAPEAVSIPVPPEDRKKAAATPSASGKAPARSATKTTKGQDGDMLAKLGVELSGGSEVLTLDELASLGTAVDKATTDAQLRAVGAAVYGCRKRFAKADHLKELAARIVAGRCELCKASDLGNLESMAAAFVSIEALAEKDASTLISAAKSRLNIEN